MRIRIGIFFSKYLEYYSNTKKKILNYYYSNTLGDFYHHVWSV